MEEPGNLIVGGNSDPEEEFIDADEIMAVTATCQTTGCTSGGNGTAWSWTGDAALAAVLLANHHQDVHRAAAAAPATDRRPRPPPLQPPRLDAQCSEARFDEFKVEWEFYKRSVEMPDGSGSSYLLLCLPEEVRKDVQAATNGAHTMTEVELLATIKQYAVLQRAVSSMKMDLYGMKQDDGEPVRKFYARVQTLARQCQLTIPCPEVGCRYHNAPFISYADEVVKQVVLCGIADLDIKKEILGTTGINAKSLTETLGLIEDKETAARSTANNGAAAHTTSYKKIMASDKRLQGTGKCEKCGKTFNNKKVRSRRGQDDRISTFKMCMECWRKDHPLSQTKNRHKSAESEEKQAQSNATESNAAAITDTFSFFASECSRRRRRGRRPPTTIVAATTETIDAMSYDSVRGWVTRHEDHGRVKISVYTIREDAAKFKLAYKEVRPTSITAVADSGCQACLMGLGQLYKLGLKKSDLARIRSSSTSINGSRLNVIGVVVLRLAGKDPTTGRTVETAAQVRVADGVKDLFLSKTVMKELGIIPADFPRVTAAGSDEKPMDGNTGVETCPGGCKKRGPPPPLPDELPFPATEENVPKMRAWLLDRYATSTFNKCGHQRLPMMSCEPLRIHIDPEAKPIAAHNARPVPIHLRDKVKAQLDEDVRLGVIERVPVGTETTWQARMCVVTKPNGDPRRTVDYRHLNKNCLRENEHIVSPCKQARLIPARVYKTKSDAWNGYHSCPLAQEDRDKTTFITEYGRYRYRVAPQGFVASGDAYNQRFGRVLDAMERKTRCVDDVAMWDENLDEHWWRVMKYLDLLAKNGIILSPNKFQFASHEIDFAGFRVTDTGVKPLPKYLDAIKNFPRPTNISDVRSWFGLVNQVAHYAKLVDIMAPFKPLLSPKVKFKWDDELEEAFEESKLAIVEAIKEGVEIFDPEKKTVICTDYSKTGVGYFLYQKTCDCKSDITSCCPTGWRVTLAGSRFLHQAEVNYWPTEGEMLAVAWALHDSRFFTLGCRDLHVQTDHRALVKLLGDKKLEDIDNRRLVNLKEKTMAWNFTISWVPGTAIPAPDATSRRPQSATDTVDNWPQVALAALRIDEVAGDDLAGDKEFAAYGRLKAGEINAVTWERVEEETWRSEPMRQLIGAIKDGLDDKDVKEIPEGVAEYWRHRHSLHIVDGVVMMGERIVIPPSLRHEVLVHLHGAHQGVSQMTGRAQTSFFWPGINTDIAKTRDNCRTCDTVAPSQPPLEAVPPEIPTSPFQQICSDYFDLQGTHYLVTVDRFTGWVDVRRAEPGTDESGAKGLITAMKETFMAFGVPEEVANDGGPEYKSHEFGQFLKRWGVRLRTSSAYHAQSNGRAEVAVKSVKRALRDNTGPDGRLDTDTFARALLLLRNTPDRDTGTSPAELLFGRRLRDALPHPYARRQSLIANDSPVDRRWLEMWSERESALRVRAAQLVDRLDARAHDLAPLEIGDRVRVQDQTGPHKTRWSRTGQVMEINPAYDMYHVKMDGSRRTTARNRKFLRKIRATGPGTSQQVDETARPDRRPADTWEDQRDRAPPLGEDRSERGHGDIADTRVETPAHRTPGSTPGRHRPVMDRPGQATPARPAWQTPRRMSDEIPLRRRVTFDDAPPAGHGPADETPLAEPDLPATPAATREQPPAATSREHQTPPPREGGRPARNRKMPSRFQDYEMAEMSAPEEVRRPPSSDDEASDVGGMKEDDSHGTDQSAIDATEQSDIYVANRVSGSARVNTRSETRANQLGNVVLRLKDLLVEYDIDRVTAALIIGRLALDI